MADRQGIDGQLIIDNHWANTHGTVGEERPWRRFA